MFFKDGSLLIMNPGLFLYAIFILAPKIKATVGLIYSKSQLLQVLLSKSLSHLLQRWLKIQNVQICEKIFSDFLEY